MPKSGEAPHSICNGQMAKELEKAQAGDRIQLFITHCISIELLLFTKVYVRHGGEGKEEKDKPPASMVVGRPMG